MAQHQDRQRHEDHPVAQVADRDRDGQAAQGGVPEDVDEAEPGVPEQPAGGGRVGLGVVQRQQHQRCQAGHRPGDHDRQGPAAKGDQRPRQRRPEDAGNHVEVAVDGVGALPEVAGHEDGEEGADPGRAEGSGQGLEACDQEQQRGWQPVEKAQPPDQQEGGAGQDVVEDDQPPSTVAVEQRPGDRRHQRPREDAQEDDPTRQRRRVVAPEREEDQRDGAHLAGGSRQQGAGHDPRKAGDAQQRAIGPLLVDRRAHRR